MMTSKLGYNDFKCNIVYSYITNGYKPWTPCMSEVLFINLQQLNFSQKNIHNLITITVMQFNSNSTEMKI